MAAGSAPSASPQSRVIDGRDGLEARVAEPCARATRRSVPRPRALGRLSAAAGASFEFWQGRPSRLHDRLRYTRAEEGWRIERLAP